MGKRPGSRLARVELGPRGVWRDYGRSSVVSGVHSQSDAGGVSGIAHAMSCTPSATQGDAGGVSGIAHAMSCTPSAAPAPPASMKSVGRPFHAVISIGVLAILLQSFPIRFRSNPGDV